MHDVCGPYGGLNYVDIPNVFKDFSADESDPKSYDSATTYITTLRAAESLPETSLCWTEIPAEFRKKFRRVFLYIKFNRPPAHCNALYQSDRGKACDKTAASVADKRQRNPRHGHKTYAHSDIFDNVEEKHCADSGAHKRAERVMRIVSCAFKAAVNYDKQ